MLQRQHKKLRRLNFSKDDVYPPIASPIDSPEKVASLLSPLSVLAINVHCDDRNCGYASDLFRKWDQVARLMPSFQAAIAAALTAAKKSSLLPRWYSNVPCFLDTVYRGFKRFNTFAQTYCYWHKWCDNSDPKPCNDYHDYIIQASESSRTLRLRVDWGKGSTKAIVGACV